MARQRSTDGICRDYRHGMRRGRGIQWAGAYRRQWHGRRVGHNPLPWMDEDELRYREEVPCYCGKQGCIETFISGTGFATDYHRLSGHALKGSEIIRLVEESDPVAELALRRYELRLAKSLAHVVNILDPDVIVLGGGMSNVDRLYQTVPQLIKQFVFGGECETPVRKAKHGDSSGVRGAAWLWPQE